ncbi:MAG: LysM peptidoglycan-binding domain-containing protein, partial [Muribaculaceae bacterium]|nr:LysM peptidoglycan-binding domain-containing protein [Muribaculaceae bacterium]
MNILRKAALIISAVTALSAAAFTLDLPIETINGIEYYVYRVAPKETVYSITRKLGITRDQLIQANPAVADGLRAGETLLFPTDKTQPTIKEEPKEELKEEPQEAPEETPEEESPIPPITPIPPISPIT